MDTDHLLYQKETVSQTQKRISGPQKEKNKTGTGTNELIQSNIGRLILLKKKKKVSTRNHWVTQESYSTLCNILHWNRTWKRRYIRIRTSESSSCWSKRKKNNNNNTIWSFNYIRQFKLGNKSTKKESERLTLLTSGHGDPDGVTSLENELVSKTGESHCRQILWQEMWPHDGPWIPPALHMSTQSPEAGEPTCWETKPASPNNWWSLWAATGLQGPPATVCPLGWASYLQPPSLGSPHLQMTAPSAEWCPQTGMCPGHPG